MSKKCRSCGEYFDGVSIHWTKGSCTGPELSSYQRELIEGMLLGNGWLTYGNKHPKLEVAMTNKTFIEWLMKELGYICTGNAFVDDEKTNITGGVTRVRKVYKIQTHTLESLRKYKNWLDDIWRKGGRSLEITPLKLKLWYVSNGSIARVDGGCHAVIFETGVENENQLESVFDSIDIEFTRATNFDKSVSSDHLRFSRPESQKLWDYMGVPLPGFEYKWPEGPTYSEVENKHTEKI